MTKEEFYKEISGMTNEQLLRAYQDAILKKAYHKISVAMKVPHEYSDHERTRGILIEVELAMRLGNLDITADGFKDA